MTNLGCSDNGGVWIIEVRIIEVWIIEVPLYTACMQKESRLHVCNLRASQPLNKADDCKTIAQLCTYILHAYSYIAKKVASYFAIILHVYNLLSYNSIFTLSFYSYIASVHFVLMQYQCIVFFCLHIACVQFAFMTKHFPYEKFVCNLVCSLQLHACSALMITLAIL